MKSQIIFFDLDDTLVNTRQTILRRINLLLDKYPFDITSQYIYRLLGSSERESILARKIGEKTLFWDDYEALRKNITVDSISGANTLLETLVSKRKNIGIITDNTCQKTLIKLQSAKINPALFNGNIYSCSEKSCLKPSVGIISYLRVNPKKILYIGDDLIDYEFARNSGIGFYGVCTGEHSREDFIENGLNRSRIFPSVKEIV